MIKDSLSPNTSTVDVLAHLQKEMSRVLQNDTLDTKEKLSAYNDLMTKSRILTSKAKSMFMEPYTHDSPLQPQHPPPPLDIDTHLSGDKTKPEKRPVPVRQKAKKKFSVAIPEALQGSG